MSYLVLARKYRPRNFSEMVGQGHVVQALSNALQTQRLHHAYLFTGTRGVGKTTVSRILAKSLNCVGPDGAGGITDHPCGQCQPCRDIDAGRFVDYTELDAASNRGVDEVQQLLEQAVYKPVQGRFKVFMIDEVHMLTNTAFNAMLKTLEEPPEYLKFVLATTDPQKVPVTVLSRCLQFNLRPMAPETVQSHLGQVLAAEHIPAEAAALRLIARAARGSMRDALSLTDQAIAFGDGRIEAEPVRQMLGSVDRSHVFSLIAALAEGDGRTVVETVETLRTHGLSAAATLEDMAAVLQRMAVLQAAPAMAPEQGESDADDEAAHTGRLAAALPPDETQLLYSICLHGRAELGLAPDEYAGLTMTLLRLLAFKPPAAAIAEKKTLKTAAPGRAEALASSPSPSPSLQGATAGHSPAPTPNPASTPVAPAPVPSAPSASTLSPPAGRAAATQPPPAADDRRRAAPPDRPGESPSTAPAAAQPNEPPPWDDDDPGPAPDDWMPEAAAAGASPGPLATKTIAADAPGVVAVPVVAQPEPGPRTGAQAAPAAFAAAPHGDDWHAVVSALVAAEAVTALARELALQSQLVAREGRHWLLRTERGSLDQPATRERLRAALAAAGHAESLAVETGPVTDTPARRNALAQQALQREAEQLVRDDPFVQQMQRDFGARIGPVTVRPRAA